MLGKREREKFIIFHNSVKYPRRAYFTKLSQNALLTNDKKLL